MKVGFPRAAAHVQIMQKSLSGISLTVTNRISLLRLVYSHMLTTELAGFFFFFFCYLK